MQNYLDANVLDSVCFRLLYCNGETDLGVLRKHEWPHAVFDRSGSMRLEGFTKTGKMHSRTKRLIMPLRVNRSDRIVWLNDPKARISLPKPQWFLSCIPKPYFGDNRWIAEGVVLCRFLFKPELRLPLYANLKGGRAGFLSNVTRRLQTLQGVDLDSLRFIRDRTNKEKGRAKKKLVENAFNMTSNLQNELVALNDGAYSLTKRGFFLLFASVEKRV